MSKPIFIVTVPNISWDTTNEIKESLFKQIGNDYHCFVVNDCNKTSFEFQMFSEKLIDPIELERLKELVAPNK
jgi:hypothetical protein